MPLYEGIGLISEKHAVVLDIGSAYTKFGYAGESHPRRIVQSPKRLFEGNRITDDELYDEFVTFIHSLYFDYLLVNPKDRRVVVVESVIGYARFRDIFAQVLFKHFEVLSILFAPSHLMPLYLLGIGTGLVFDVGHSEALLIPVYEGVPVLKAWQALPLASQAVQQSLRNSLGEDNSDLPDNVIEDITVRFCFIAGFERGQQIQKAKFEEQPLERSSTQAIPYPIKGNKIIQVSGNIRESIGEVLFEQDNDRLSVSTMILNAILECPVDTRRDVAENIIFIGGTTMMPGFKSRIIKEVRYLCEKDSHYASLKLKDSFKVHRPPGRANCVAWIGASIFGATDAVSTRSLCRDQYLKDEAIPDWSNLKFNLLEISNSK